MWLGILAEEHHTKQKNIHNSVKTYFGPKKVNFTAKQIKVGVVLGHDLGQIRSNIVKKVRKQTLSIVFFIFLHEEYLLKEKDKKWLYKHLSGNSRQL